MSETEQTTGGVRRAHPCPPPPARGGGPAPPPPLTASAQEAMAELARQRVEYDDADLDLPAETPHGIFTGW